MTREEAVERLVDYFEYEDGLSADKDTQEAYKMARKALENEPIKHGHWNMVVHSNNHITYYCPKCGSIFNKGCADLGEYNYCPNCGERMDGTNKSVDLGNGFSISVNESQFNPQGRDCLECLYSPTCYGAGIGKPACRAFVPRVRYVDSKDGGENGI